MFYLLIISINSFKLYNHYYYIYLQFNGNVVDRRRFVIKSNKRNALSAAAAEAAGEERAPESAEGEPSVLKK